MQTDVRQTQSAARLRRDVRGIRFPLQTARARSLLKRTGLWGLLPRRWRRRVVIRGRHFWLPG